MVGDDRGPSEHGGGQAERLHHLAHVAGEGRHARRPLGPGRLQAQQVAVVLEHGPAAGRVGDDRIEVPARAGGPLPGVDVGLGGELRVGLPPHVVDEGATAPGARHHRHLGAVAGQQAHRRLVDCGAEHLLGTAGEQRHPHAPRSQGREDLGPVDGRRSGGRARGEGEHRAEATRQQPAEGSGEDGADQRQAEQRRARQHERDHGAERALTPGTPVGLLDARPCLVDKVHVVDAGRTGGHAREAGEAPVDVERHPGRGRPVSFQHVLDQVNASAGAVQFVSEQDIRRTGGRAEATMHAGPENGVGLPELRIGQLLNREPRLHRCLRHSPAYMRPGLRTPLGSKPSLTRRVRARSGAGWGSNTGTRERTAAAARTRVAWPPLLASAVRTSP